MPFGVPSFGGQNPKKTSQRWHELAFSCQIARTKLKVGSTCETTVLGLRCNRKYLGTLLEIVGGLIPHTQKFPRYLKKGMNWHFHAKSQNKKFNLGLQARLHAKTQPPIYSDNIPKIAGGLILNTRNFPRYLKSCCVYNACDYT